MHINPEGPRFPEERLILAGNIVLNENEEILLLFRIDHGYYETPGGKIKPSECKNPKQPTTKELAEAAERELYEELDDHIVVEKLKYFDRAEFIIPDGRLAVANKFLTRITSGTPRINEPEIFSKLDWLPLATLEEYPISPDLKILLPRLKTLIKK